MYYINLTQRTLKGIYVFIYWQHKGPIFICGNQTAHAWCMHILSASWSLLLQFGIVCHCTRLSQVLCYVCHVFCLYCDVFLAALIIFFRKTILSDKLNLNLGYINDFTTANSNERELWLLTSVQKLKRGEFNRKLVTIHIFTRKRLGK